MKDNNHYERAFEGLLRERSLPYVAVREVHRSAFADVDLKSFDFIVYLPEQKNLLVDVKGRKAKPGKKDWNFDPWVGEEDLSALSTWQEIFGNSFSAVFVFAFWLADANHVDLFESYRFEGNFYRFYSVYLDDYRQYQKVRSPKWKTLTIPRPIFHELSIDCGQILTDLSGKK